MSIVSSPRKLYVIGNGFDKHHGLPVIGHLSPTKSEPHQPKSFCR